MKPLKPKELTDLACRNAKSAEKPWKLHDTRGLFLLVNPNGTKWWRLRYTLAGKDGLLSLGVYPDVPLSEARKRRDEARERIALGENPAQARRNEKVKATAGTFEALFAEWVETQRGDWAPSNLKKITEMAEANLLPYLRGRPVTDVRPAELLAILRRPESRGALDLARRCGMILLGVFRLALASGRSETNPALGLNALLKKPITKHRAAITDRKQMSNLVRDIAASRSSPTVRAALRLSPLTMLRPGELRQLPWSAVNLVAGEILVPVAIRKLKAVEKRTAKPHWVPLSAQAVDVLRELQPLTGNLPFVFPGERSPRAQCMSDGSVLAALRRMGYDKETMSAHGFRGMATSALMEMGFKREAIDRQLAHKDRDKVFAAYDRAEYRDERRAMMQAWANYLDSLTFD